MAKFSRFDPRNKKNNRNKKISMTKEHKIKDVELDKLKKRLIKDVHTSET